MNYAVLTTTLALGISSSVMAQEVSSTCQNLIDELLTQSNVVGTPEVFECGPSFTRGAGKTAPVAVNGCLVTYEYQLSDIIVVGAFHDTANNHEVGYIFQGYGETVSGHHLCADVKTYVSYKISGNQAAITVSRRTAADAMFCPFGKIFTEYRTTCRKVR